MMHLDAGPCGDSAKCARTLPKRGAMRTCRSPPCNLRLHNPLLHPWFKVLESTVRRKRRRSSSHASPEATRPGNSLCRPWSSRSHKPFLPQTSHPSILTVPQALKDHASARYEQVFFIKSFSFLGPSLAHDSKAEPSAEAQLGFKVPKLLGHVVSCNQPLQHLQKISAG